jgi:predicted AAA+ superfamily ATPase
MSLAERSDEEQTVSLRELLGGTRPRLRGETSWRLKDYVDEILRSGLPGVRRFSGRALKGQLDSYLHRIVDRDFPELGHQIRNPAALRRWMEAYAAASATSMTFAKIRDAATRGHGETPSQPATLPYRDILERLWILDPVPAWAPTRNYIRRLTLPPKHQLADPALAARLLDADSDVLLSGEAPGPFTPRDGTLLGALFESLVTLSVRVYAQAAEASVYHLRTSGGSHEVDLIVARGGRVVAIEVKLARTPDDADFRNLHWLARQVGDELLDAVMITTGPAAYRRQDGIAVVPASLLGP